MLTRRRVLSGATGLAGIGAARAAMLRPSILDNVDPGLRDMAARRGVAYGAALSTYQLDAAGFASVFAREAAIIVPEYEMKRGVIEAQRGQYDFTACDRLAEFAHNRGLAMRGHPLIWHKRNPDWLEGAVLESRNPRLFTDYITTVIQHFAGRVRSWDVVNEAIEPSDGRRDGLRNSFWLKAYGSDYIDEAYHAARAADPAAQLVYNDWGFEAGAPDNDRFRAATLRFLDGALARNVPIDVLGIQGHLAAYGAKVDQKKLRDFLDDVRALGLGIFITEHDVDDSDGPSRIDERDSAVADASRRFLDVALANPATRVVITWGLSDRFLAAPGGLLAGHAPRMLPLDAGFARKPMWHAIASSFLSA
jgi:endo-1,4-beta-xylanase